MVEGAENYQIIKQRPSDHDQQQSQVSNPDNVAEPQNQNNANEEFKVAQDVVNNGDANKDAEEPQPLLSTRSQTGRISTLNDIDKFQASLDKNRIQPSAQSANHQASQQDEDQKIDEEENSDDSFEQIQEAKNGSPEDKGKKEDDKEVAESGGDNS